MKFQICMGLKCMAVTQNKGGELMEFKCSKLLALSKNLQKHYFILDSNKLKTQKQSLK